MLDESSLLSGFKYTLKNLKEFYPLEELAKHPIIQLRRIDYSRIKTEQTEHDFYVNLEPDKKYIGQIYLATSNSISHQTPNLPSPYPQNPALTMICRNVYYDEMQGFCFRLKRGNLKIFLVGEDFKIFGNHKTERLLSQALGHIIKSKRRKI